jgi:hypothetical protein
VVDTGTSSTLMIRPVAMRLALLVIEDRVYINLMELKSIVIHSPTYHLQGYEFLFFYLFIDIYNQFSL